MGAEQPRRRKMTAREAANRFGVTTRTIQRIVAEPREDYESRALTRQDEALALRSQGLSHAEVGKALGVSRNAAAGLVRRGRQRQQQLRTAA
jgi:transposase